MEPFLESALPSQDPFELFEIWRQDALSTADDPALVDAMMLATASKDGVPSCRPVQYCPSIDQHGFVFFTDINSIKGQNLAENPNAAATFTWPSRRVLRLEGPVVKLPKEIAEEIFKKLPVDCQITLVAGSPQSQIVASREALLKTCENVKQKYVASGLPVPMPDDCFCISLKPTRFEFCVHHANFFTDRIQFLRQSFVEKKWTISRLSP